MSRGPSPNQWTSLQWTINVRVVFPPGHCKNSPAQRQIILQERLKKSWTIFCSPVQTKFAACLQLQPIPFYCPYTICFSFIAHRHIVKPKTRWKNSWGVAAIQVFLFFGNLANCPIWQALQCGRLLVIPQANPTSKSKLPNHWVRLLTHTHIHTHTPRARAIPPCPFFSFGHEAAMRSPIRSSKEVTKSAAAWEMPMKPVGRDSAAVGTKKE